MSDRRAENGEALLRDLSQLLDRVGVVGRRLEEETDLAEAQASSLGGVDDRQRSQDLRPVTAPPALAHRLRQQPDRLVVADRRRSLAAEPRNLADREKLA